MLYGVDGWASGAPDTSYFQVSHTLQPIFLLKGMAAEEDASLPGKGMTMGGWDTENLERNYIVWLKNTEKKR